MGCGRLERELRLRAEPFRDHPQATSLAGGGGLPTCARDCRNPTPPIPPPQARGRGSIVIVIAGVVIVGFLLVHSMEVSD